MTARSVSKICSVEGCENKHFGLGLCNMHYKRQRTYGSTDARERQPCIAEDCSNLRAAHGYCQKHSMRLRRNGTLAFQYVSPLEDHTRFWSQVAITANADKCWEWNGNIRDKNGYGRLSLPGRKSAIGAHRVAFFLHNGYWATPIVRHSCDNPPCCNPAHLLEGTAKDNSRDMVERGRVARGERNTNAKLTDEHVMAIRATGIRFGTGRGKGSPFSQKALAAKYGVSRRVIKLILEGESWRHIT